MKTRSNNVAGILDIACAISLMVILLVSLNIAIFYVPGQGGFAFPSISISQNTADTTTAIIATARGIVNNVGNVLVNAVQYSTVFGG